MSIITRSSARASGPAAPGRSRTPTRRTLLLGVGTLGAGLAVGAGPAAAAPTLRKGDRSSDVTALQEDLTSLNYWCGEADGSFGHITEQAVFALQKAGGLATDGIVGPDTYGAIADGVQPSREQTEGYSFEVDLSTQLITATWDSDLRYILNTSTGSGEEYYSDGRWKTATTPEGDFEMYSFYPDGWQSGSLGDLYRPGYYDRGWAIHGSTSIPTYPASHGCCRISTAATDMLWSRGWMVEGRRVHVHA
ncbi:peptidoglycan-binding protein [Brachybacterium sp. GCM10030268]|uniref:L,D-transpeptidase family protein n=1 Tax=Brachybacterium sp. GCM10030268 TaxID=3273382 RepID=UPI00360F4E47